jgi:hypothetical protein
MHRTLKKKALDTGRASGQLSVCAAGVQHRPDAAQCVSPDASVLTL